MTQSAILRRAGAFVAGTAAALLLHAPVLGQEGGAADGANTVQGVVTQEDGTTPITGAVVSVPAANAGTLTDREGWFTLENLPDGEHTLRIQATGYGRQSQTISLPTQAGQELSFALETSAFQLGGVVATVSPLSNPVTYQPAQAYDAEEIQRRTATSLGELLDGEPGLSMRSFGPVPARPVIRGLDGDRLVVLENGERMGDLAHTAVDHAISLDPLSVDRVEVVRGPASLLYGTSALGGVINLQNRDIPREWAQGLSGGVAAQGATVNTLGAGFGRFTYGADRWAATGRLSYRGSGDLTTPEGVLLGTRADNTEGGAGVAYNNGGFDAGLAVSFLDNMYGLPDAPDDADGSVDIGMDRQTVQGRANLAREGFLNNVELRLNATRYFHDEIEKEVQPDGSIDEELELFYLQYALSSTLTVRHEPIGPFSEGALGFNLLVRDLEVGGEEGLTPNAQSNFLAAFLFEEIPVNDMVRLQFGARSELQLFSALPNERFPDVRDDRSGVTFSGSVGANVQPTDNLEFGLQVARAHRAPLVEELYTDAAHLGTGAYEIGDPSLGNEIGYGFDAFTRLTFDRVRAEFAGFVNRIDDYIVLQPTGETHEPSGFPIQEFEADNAQLFGGEATLEALVSDELRVTTGVDYVQGSRRDAAGTPLPFMPPFRTRVGATYDSGDWWLGGNARLVGSQDRVADEEEPTDGYALLGFESGYRFDRGGRHVISLRLDNALDSTYRDHLSRVEGRNFPMPGRNLNLVYRYSF